jgi:hypothetical protein
MVGGKCSLKALQLLVTPYCFIFICTESTGSVNLGGTNVQGKIYFVGLFTAWIPDRGLRLLSVPVPIQPKAI